MRNASPNPTPSLIERAQFALDHPDIQHSPADLREIIAGLLSQFVSVPAGFGVMARAHNAYNLQPVVYPTRRQAEDAAGFFVRECDPHVVEVYVKRRAS